MKPETRRHTLVWLFLLALTVLSFSASAPGGRQAAAFILAAAGVKAIVLAWNFMELRHAHPLWKTTLVLMIAGLLAAVQGLHRSGRASGQAAGDARSEKAAASPSQPTATSQNLTPVKALPGPPG